MLKAVYRESDGELISTGTVVAPATVLQAKGYAVADVGDAQPDAATHIWDRERRCFVPREEPGDDGDEVERALAAMNPELRAKLEERIRQRARP